MGLERGNTIPSGAQQGQSFIEPSIILSYVSGFDRGLKNRVVNEAGGKKTLPSQGLHSSGRDAQFAGKHI